MWQKYTSLVLYFSLIACFCKAQTFHVKQPYIIDSQDVLLAHKSNKHQNKVATARQNMDILYPKPDSINNSITTGVYWRIHNDFLPQEYVYILNDEVIQDSINLKYKNAIVNFLWLNDSFNEDSVTYTFNSIAPIKLDSIYFTYAHVNRSNTTNFIRTRVVNVNINTGIPILTDEPIWENIIETDTSLTAPNNDPSYLFNDVMVIPLSEPILFNLPFAVVVDFYGGDKKLDEFYLLNTYNNSCTNDDTALAQHSKFYPNSFFNISAQFGNTNIEGLFPLSPNGILGIDANGNEIVGESEFCEAFYIQNWHIGVTVSFEAELVGNIVSNTDTLCKGDILTLEANANFGSPPYSYLWQYEDGSPISTQKQIDLAPQNNETYILRITDALDNSILARKEIIFNTLNLTMPEDISLNCAIAFEITPEINSSTDNNITYNWITGSTASKITVFPGNYSLTVTDGYCFKTDSINVGINSDILADFEAAVAYGGLINFSNLSTNATNYFWDFGDGKTSTDKNPSHIYENIGIYTVSLNVLNGNCSIYKYKTINLNDLPVGLNDKEFHNEVTISPNPSHTGIFWLTLNPNKSNKNFSYTIYDSSGKALMNKISVNKQNKFSIDLKDLPNSTYFLQIFDKQHTIIKKLLLIR